MASAPIWYFVDRNHARQGPLTLQELQRRYLESELWDEAVVWNGRDVNIWTRLSTIPHLIGPMKVEKERRRAEAAAASSGSHRASIHSRSRTMSSVSSRARPSHSRATTMASSIGERVMPPKPRMAPKKALPSLPKGTRYDHKAGHRHHHPGRKKPKGARGGHRTAKQKGHKKRPTSARGREAPEPGPKGRVFPTSSSSGSDDGSKKTGVRKGQGYHTSAKKKARAEAEAAAALASGSSDKVRFDFSGAESSSDDDDGDDPHIVRVKSRVTWENADGSIGELRETFRSDTDLVLGRKTDDTFYVPLKGPATDGDSPALSIDYDSDEAERDDHYTRHTGPPRKPGSTKSSASSVSSRASKGRRRIGYAKRGEHSGHEKSPVKGQHSTVFSGVSSSMTDTPKSISSAPAVPGMAHASPSDSSRRAQAIAAAAIGAGVSPVHGHAPGIGIVSAAAVTAGPGSSSVPTREPIHRPPMLHDFNSGGSGSAPTTVRNFYSVPQSSQTPPASMGAVSRGDGYLGSRGITHDPSSHKIPEPSHAELYGAPMVPGPARGVGVAPGMHRGQRSQSMASPDLVDGRATLTTSAGPIPLQRISTMPSKAGHLSSQPPLSPQLVPGFVHVHASGMSPYVSPLSSPMPGVMGPMGPVGPGRASMPALDMTAFPPPKKKKMMGGMASMSIAEERADPSESNPHYYAFPEHIPEESGYPAMHDGYSSDGPATPRKASGSGIGKKSMWGDSAKKAVPKGRSNPHSSHHDPRGRQKRAEDIQLAEIDEDTDMDDVAGPPPSLELRQSQTKETSPCEAIQTSDSHTSSSGSEASEYNPADYDTAEDRETPSMAPVAYAPLSHSERQFAAPSARSGYHASHSNSSEEESFDEDSDDMVVPGLDTMAVDPSHTRKGEPSLASPSSRLGRTPLFSVASSVSVGIDPDKLDQLNRDFQAEKDKLSSELKREKRRILKELSSAFDKHKSLLERGVVKAELQLEEYLQFLVVAQRRKELARYHSVTDVTDDDFGSSMHLKGILPGIRGVAGGTGAPKASKMITAPKKKSKKPRRMDTFGPHRKSLTHDGVVPDEVQESLRDLIELVDSDESDFFTTDDDFDDDDAPPSGAGHYLSPSSASNYSAGSGGSRTSKGHGKKDSKRFDFDKVKATLAGKIEKVSLDAEWRKIKKKISRIDKALLTI